MAANGCVDLAPKRRERLIELVSSSRVMRVAELCEELGASPATVRRDLEELERAGKIRRVHGGAMAVQNRLEEPLFEHKTSIAAREKHAIARAALKTIGPNETVYLDGGSTLLELARLLRDRADVTVVTNSLRAALELSGRGPRVIIVGGELRRLSQTTIGPLSAGVIGKLRPDKAFMGTIGLDLETGLTTTDPNEAHTKRLAMEASQEVVLLADSSKIGQVSFVCSGTIQDLDTIIVDEKADAAFLRKVSKAGVKVIRARA